MDSAKGMGNVYDKRRWDNVCRRGVTAAGFGGETDAGPPERLATCCIMSARTATV